MPGLFFDIYPSEQLRRYRQVIHILLTTTGRFARVDPAITLSMSIYIDFSHDSRTWPGNWEELRLTWPCGSMGFSFVSALFKKKIKIWLPRSWLWSYLAAAQAEEEPIQGMIGL